MVGRATNNDYAWVNGMRLTVKVIRLSLMFELPKLICVRQVWIKEWFIRGTVEKSRQRRSRHFSVLTYWKYAPRAKMTAALLNELF
jgi:hypothetical protein